MIIRRNITIDYIFEQLKESVLNKIFVNGEKIDIEDIFFNLEKRKRREKFENEFEELRNNIEDYKFIKVESLLNCFLIKNKEKWYKLNYRVNFYTYYMFDVKRKKVDRSKAQIIINCVFYFEIHKEIIDENGKNKEIVFISSTL
jgi:hypothetical protein